MSSNSGTSIIWHVSSKLLTKLSGGEEKSRKNKGKLNKEVVMQQLVLEINRTGFKLAVTVHLSQVPT